MPITIPAHQLLVLPLILVRGGRLPGSALMVGTTLADLAYVVGGYTLSGPAHELYGPLFLVPTLGVVLYLWCELQLVPALRRALPASWAPLFATRGLPARIGGWGFVLAALAIGAFTHALFDGLTHHWMWPADRLYADVQLGGVRLTKVLQVVVSVLGSIAVVVWAYRRVKQCAPIAADRRWRANLGTGIASGLGCAVIALGVWLVACGWPAHARAARLLACPATCGAFLGVAAAIWLQSRRRPIR